MFAVRLRVPVGTVHVHRLAKLEEPAERFGDGFIHITSRQGIEIPGVRFGDLEALRQELATVGLAPGSCGPRVRNILACPGNRSCSHSFVDSRAFGETLDRLFVGKDFCTKIRIAVSGCPNSCTTRLSERHRFRGRCRSRAGARPLQRLRLMRRVVQGRGDRPG
ncbi:MAG: hypothetical protein HYX94_12150 [Chloroflexi bacterium]|nr:hypothetical protein [Chloroflexota bacterium]